MFRQARINKQITLIKSEDDPNPNIHFVSTQCIDEHNINITVLLIGPEGSAYEGGKFYVQVYISQGYPYKLFTIKFITPIYHAFVYKDGHICNCIFREFQKYFASSNKIIKALEKLLNLMAHVQNFPTQIGCDHREQFYSNREFYYRNAKLWTEKYANN